MEHELHAAINTMIDEMEDVANVVAYMGTAAAAGSGDAAVNEGQRLILQMVEVRIRNNVEALASALRQPVAAPSCSNS